MYYYTKKRCAAKPKISTQLNYGQTLCPQYYTCSNRQTQTLCTLTAYLYLQGPVSNCKPHLLKYLNR